MSLFSSLYAWTMRWSRHPRAPWFLGGLSFAESSFFPIPPDVMLAPMAMANPKKAWYYAALTTLTSVLGGMLGYFIGLYFIETIEPMLHSYGYWEKYQLASNWFAEYGFWAVLIAGFSPIPYKVFTISAGAASMLMLPFIVASIIGRGARFFLVAALMAWGGPKAEQLLHKYVDRIGWAVVVLAVVGYLLLK